MKRPAAAKGEALLESAAEAHTPVHKGGGSSKRKKDVQDAPQGFRISPPRRHQRSQTHSTSLVPWEALQSLTGVKVPKNEELAGAKKGKDSGSNGALVEPTPPVDDAAGGEDQQVRCSLYPSGPEV